MAVTGGAKVIKYLLFVFNLLFLLAGLVLIIVGAVATAGLSRYNTMGLGASPTAMGVIFIIIGGIVFIMAFFGCCGAYKENHCMLITFIVFMVIVLLVVLAIAITAFVFTAKLSNWMLYSLKRYNDSDIRSAGKNYKHFWDDIQNTSQCCGVYNYTDWGQNNYITNDSVPDSCCFSNVTKVFNCGEGQLLNPNHIYKEGCGHKFITFLKHHLEAVGGTAVAVGIIVLIGIIFACYFIHGIHGEYISV